MIFFSSGFSPRLECSCLLFLPAFALLAFLFLGVFSELWCSRITSLVDILEVSLTGGICWVEGFDFTNFTCSDVVFSFFKIFGAVCCDFITGGLFSLVCKLGSIFEVGGVDFFERLSDLSLHQLEQIE